MDSSLNIMRLKCGFVNIQSVGNKTMQIREIISDQTLDILALSETWLEDYDPAKINEMTPPTHTFWHIPRGSRGEGLVYLFRALCLI